jgi:hypothetical protein
MEKTKANRNRFRDALGRDRTSITLKHLVPYWIYIIMILTFNYRGLRTPLVKDFFIVLTSLHWIIVFPWSMLGVFPLFGRAPYSETSFSVTTFKNAIHLAWMTIVGFWLSIIASIPVVCVLYTVFSRWQMTRAVYAPNDNNSDERWFFINGISNTPGMGFLNQKRLEQLFGRKITLIYNPTQGVFLDLLECIGGRTFEVIATPAATAIHLVRLALLNPKVTKVVLIGHSQGCIVSQTVLEHISPEAYTAEVLKNSRFTHLPHPLLICQIMVEMCTLNTLLTKMMPLLKSEF